MTHAANRKKSSCIIHINLIEFIEEGQQQGGGKKRKLPRVRKEKKCPIYPYSD